jgi:hypothetical protein
MVGLQRIETTGITSKVAVADCLVFKMMHMNKDTIFPYVPSSPPHIRADATQYKADGTSVSPACAAVYALAW